MNKKTTIVFLVLAAVIIILIWKISSGENTVLPTVVLTPTPIITKTPTVLGTQTKTNGCKVDGLMPDKECTPGAIFPNVTTDQICVPGYSQTVRNVPDSEKKTVYSEYGILIHQTGEYEVDHYISLELGGSNDIANLWPEAANPTPGFHEKDKVENYLHQQVCKGSITLQQAQQEISTDWMVVYKQIRQ